MKQCIILTSNHAMEHDASQESPIMSVLYDTPVKQDAQDCPICLETIVLTQNCYITQCKHAFHGHCFMKCIMTKNEIETKKLACPLCRQLTIPNQYLTQYVELEFDEGVLDMLPFEVHHQLYANRHNQNDVVVYEKNDEGVIVLHDMINTMILFFKQILCEEVNYATLPIQEKCQKAIENIMHFEFVPTKFGRFCNEDSADTRNSRQEYCFSEPYDEFIDEIIKPCILKKIKHVDYCRIIHTFESQTWELIELKFEKTDITSND